MEVKADEIETLRNALSHNSTAQEIADALAILDRLSPPAPEVDEATNIWREMQKRSCDAIGYKSDGLRASDGEWDESPSAKAQISYLRTALSELIASKDGEIADAKLSAKHSADWSQAAIERAEKAESELAALRAENERLRIALDDAGIDVDQWVKCERAAGNIPSPKAAERNTAEPATETTPEGMTPEEIVRKLTKAQREAIHFLTSEWQSPYDLKRLGQKGGFTVLEALHRRGIADERQDRGSMFMPHTQYKYRLNSLGLEVRRLLENTHD